MPVTVTADSRTASQMAETPFVFLGDGVSLFAAGTAEVVSAPQAELPGRVAAYFAAQPPAATPRLLVGAMAFAAHQPAWLAAATAITVPPAFVPRSWPRPALGVVAEPSPSDYRSAVTQILARLSASDRGALQKVVLSRRLRMTFDAPLDPLALVEGLRADRQATTFCVPLPVTAAGQARSLVGATPELLLSKRGRAIQSSPLAGSARRHADSAQDRLAATVLERSGKDLREHRAVVEFIADILSPYCRTLEVPSTPRLVSTSAMWHLGTQIAGELNDAAVSAVELAARLHPTPAVCGTPRDAAMAAIAELEPFDRGFYSGVVGWCDAAGDGQWMVAIRCGEIAGDTALVYAGAGIVPGSDPARECEETSAKFTTLLRALGVDETGDTLEAES